MSTETPRITPGSSISRPKPTRSHGDGRDPANRSTAPLFPFIEHDGGRAAAGFKGNTGDCVTRAIAIATGTEYRVVYDELHQRAREFADAGRTRLARSLRDGKSGGVSPRNGVHKVIYGAYLDDYGFVWHPTMAIGTGTTVHLRRDELPEVDMIVRLSKHITAIVDGVILDSHDPARDGTRAVYGYWTRPL